MELKQRTAADLLKYLVDSGEWEMKVIDAITIGFRHIKIGFDSPFTFNILASKENEMPLAHRAAPEVEKPPPTVTFQNGITIKLDDAEAYLRHMYGDIS